MVQERVWNSIVNLMNQEIRIKNGKPRETFFLNKFLEKLRPPNLL
jgi:hypothetical protein